MACVHPDDVGRVRAIVEAGIRAYEPLDYEARLVRPDGEVRSYHAALERAFPPPAGPRPLGLR